MTEMTRRLVLQAGAWTIPVVAAAVAAPAAAASTIRSATLIVQYYTFYFDAFVVNTYSAPGIGVSASYELQQFDAGTGSWSRMLARNTDSDGQDAYTFATGRGQVTAYRVVAVIDGETVYSPEVPKPPRG